VFSEERFCPYFNLPNYKLFYFHKKLKPVKQNTTMETTTISSENAQAYQFEFKGQGADYFGILIVNAILMAFTFRSLLSLGSGKTTAIYLQSYYAEW